MSHPSTILNSCKYSWLLNNSWSSFRFPTKYHFNRVTFPDLVIQINITFYVNIFQFLFILCYLFLSHCFLGWILMKRILTWTLIFCMAIFNYWFALRWCSDIFIERNYKFCLSVIYYKSLVIMICLNVKLIRALFFLHSSLLSSVEFFQGKP